MTRTNRYVRGLAAVVLIALVLFGTPTLLIFLGATPWSVDLSEVRLLLLSPDDGTLALLLVGAVAWLAWAVMTGCLVSEIVASARGVHAPRLPVIGGGQHLAAHLVAAAALLFTVAQPLAATFTAMPAHAAAPTTEGVQSAQSQVDGPVAAAEPTRHADPAVPAAPTSVSYTTRPHDSLWKIAEKHLGEGARFGEIVDLNPGLFPEGPEFLEAGTVLQLPASVVDHEEAAATDDSSYVVEKGDTLWDIADEELGDPTRYPEIYEASLDTAQPDGMRLTDPAVIYPGWELTIPDEGSPADVAPEVLVPNTPPADTAPVEPPTTTPAPSTVDIDPPTASVDEAAASTSDAETPSWLLPGLAGAGSLLAGSLFLVLRSHRRTQLRYRSPGEILEPPPQELVDVEKSARHTETTFVPRLEDLDRLLRHLAEGLELTGQSLPRVQTIEFANEDVTLHLAEAAPTPPGWSGTDTSWSFRLDHPLPDSDSTAPFPLLCTIGQTSTGRLVLANLDELGSIALLGSKEAAVALARSVAAELTLSPWAVLVDVDIVGVAAELGALDPLRLHHHEIEDTTFLDRLVTEMRHQGDTGPETFHAVVAAQTGATDQIVRLIAEHVPRLGAAVVTTGGEPREGDVLFELLDDGRLVVPSLDLNLSPAGLTADEATATAAIVALARDAAPVPPPPNRAVEPAWRAATDRSGALVPAYADALPTSEDLLSAEDEEPLLPIAEDDQRPPDTNTQKVTRVEPLDPQLDADIAAWFDENCRLPRLHLLGPARAQAHGNPAAVARRKPHYVEMLTFLALHPEGVTSTQVAEAFSLRKERVRIDVGVVRKWLGDNPRTGQPHLPAASQTRAANESGAWTYQVDDVLVDADLFRRLRARGQARGPKGQDDFDAALRLVEGAPFSDLRESGWSWLLDADSRDDEILACAIVDVAHDVVTVALAEGDLDRALTAVEIARTASPYDEVARLDLAAILVAQGHGRTAQEFLAEAVYNRADDHMGPIDLPVRTSEILGQATDARRRRR